MIYLLFKNTMEQLLTYVIVLIFRHFSLSHVRILHAFCICMVYTNICEF